MTKNYIPTINISSLVKNNFETRSAFKTIKEIENACIKIGFFQVTGHGLNLKDIKKVCDVGNKFFKLPDSKKRQLSPKKWNKKNKNLYRGYFPNDVNGKEGLDIGDLKVTKRYSSKLKNQYIEYLNLDKCFNKSSIKALGQYFDNIYNLSETLFKCVIKLNKMNPNKSSEAFSRLKTLSTLRFNYYPNQTKPVEISKQDGVYHQKNGIRKTRIFTEDTFPTM